MFNYRLLPLTVQIAVVICPAGFKQLVRHSQKVRSLFLKTTEALPFKVTI